MKAPSKSTSLVKIDRLLGQEIKRLEAERRLLKMTSPEILDRAIDTFDGAEPAAIWLSHSQVFCRGRTPLRWAKTAKGRKEVLAQLARIDYGVYS